METTSSRLPVFCWFSSLRCPLATLALIVVLAGASGVNGQEATSGQEKPPSAVLPEAVAPEVDYGRLAEPVVADSLGLNDQQKTSVQEILTARDAGLSTAEESAKAAIRADASGKLSALLTADQQRLLVSLFTEKVLRFNFRYQKWAEVLDWVAREADLSLVMDTPPPGTFHYSDSKNYSTTEAIDLLNGWLLTKGFTLVRRERMLMCLDLKGGLPEGAIPSVTPNELPARGRFEFVSVLIPLEGRPPEAALAEVKPLLGTYGKAEALAQTQQLLVFDTASNVRVIQQIVQKVPLPAKPGAPRPDPPKPQLIVYPIQHANPVQAGEVLKQIVLGVVVVDEKAKQISVNAVPDEQLKAKTIIEQLESNQGPKTQQELTLYPISTADSEQLLATMKLVSPQAQFRVDAASQRLVAWATAVEHQTISEALQKLATEQGSTGTRQLQVYALTKVEPTAAAAVLSTLLPTARITVDIRSRSLIAVGTQNDHQAISALVEQLGAEAEAARTAADLRTYPIESAQSSTAVTLLATTAPEAKVTPDPIGRRLLIMATPEDHQRIEQLIKSITVSGENGRRLEIYPARDIDTSSVTSLLTTLAPQAAVTVDTVNRRMLVIASADDHQTVNDVLEQVRGDSTSSGPELKSYALKPKITAASVTSLLASLVPRATVTPDEASRRLLISASTSDHAIIAQVMEQVEMAGGGELPELRFYPLEKADGTTLVTILRAMVPTAQLTHQPEARRLSAVAVNTDHLVIAKTIQQLEAASAESEKRVLKIYDVTAAQRTRFQSISSQLAAELPGMQVIVDAQPEELAIWATPSQQTVLSEVLAQLQRTIPAEQQAKLIVYPLKKVDPASVSAILTTLFPDAKITVDAKLRRLTIHAKPAVHESIGAAIEQLDTDIPAEKEIRLMVYPVGGLNSATALSLIKEELPDAIVIPDTTAETLIVRARLEDQQRIAELLDSLRSSASPLQERLAVSYPSVFSDQIRTTEFFASAFPKARVVMDAAKRRMTVWATQSEHEQIREAVAGMAAPEDGRSLQIFETEGMNAATLSQLLASSLPEASFVQAGSGRSVMAWLDAAQTKTAHAILQKLKESESLNGEKSLEFYSIEDLGPSVTTILSRAVPNAGISPGAKSSQLAIVASASEHEQIRQLLAQLEQTKSFPPEKLLTVHDIGGVSPAAVQQVLQPLMDSDVQVTVDPSGRQLFVRAIADKQERIGNVIKQITGSLKESSQRLTKTYVVGQPNADEAQEVLVALYPDAKIVSDSDRKLIVATALPEQHETIELITSQMRGAALDGDRPAPKIYSLKNADANEVLSLLQSTYSRFEGVRLSVNESTGRLVVVARNDQHEAIAELIQQLDDEPGDGQPQELAVFRLRQMDGRAIQEALEPLLPKSAQVTVDRVGSQMFVSGPASEMVAIRKLVEQVLAPAAGENGGLITHTYRMMPNEADEAQEALQALFPDAILVTDDGDEVLVATATPEQHVTIQTIVSEMSSVAGNSESGPRAQAYPLTLADGQSVAQALQGLFGRRDDVRVSFDSKSNSLLVVGRTKQHETVARLLEQLEQSDKTSGPRRLEIYSLKNVDSTAAVQMAEGVLKVIDPAAKVTYERQSRQLVVTATEEGQEKIREAVDRFEKRDQRVVDVIQLRYLSATSAQISLEGIFNDGLSGFDDRPLFQADDDTQQLMVRASPDQMQEIRSLLRKMGETGLSVGSDDPSSQGRLRVIPVTGDVDMTLRRIQDLWPKIRRNPVRVLSPSDLPVDEPLPANRLPAAPSQNGQFSIPAETLDEAANQSHIADETTENSGVNSAANTAENTPTQELSAQELPEVIVVPGIDRITISSDDQDALDQMEALLRAAFSKPTQGRNRDFAVYQLQNAGADEVAKTLRSVYESRAGLLAFDSVVLVPEPRMNALIVYGSRTDRERIEHLLEILDTEKLPDTARAFRTEVIPVKYTNASQIEVVIRGVYRAEMTAGGSRQSIEIPTGIPASVASVIRQINAAASSPLLTVEVQRATNSLIIKAPQALLEEVRTLVQDMDETSATNRSRTVTLVPLKKTNASRVMRVLGNVLE